MFDLSIDVSNWKEKQRGIEGYMDLTCKMYECVCILVDVCIFVVCYVCVDAGLVLKPHVLFECRIQTCGLPGHRLESQTACSQPTCLPHRLASKLI